MRIHQLTASIVRLPLKRSFTHATAARHDSDNIFVRCELADGAVGWGEGVPREYVTGETPAGCIEQLAATSVAEQLSDDVNSWPDVIRLCEAFQPAHVRDDLRDCYGNALRCAVELSILDAFGHLLKEPISKVTAHIVSAASIYAPRASVQYGAVIDAGGRHFRRSALVRRIYGFRDCKVKVGREGDDDAARLKVIRRWLGSRVDLRVDVNGAWRAAEARQEIESLVPCQLSCIEQPLAHDELPALAELRRQTPVPFMLDESLTSLIDAKTAIRLGGCDLFNIRLSKCGGFLASLKLAALAHDSGLGYQLGCHPGESGILSAAGRHWASSVANIRYVEGSYDHHLFRRLVTNEDITFGYAGRAPALNNPGLGVTIDTTALAEHTLASQSFAIA